MAVARTSAASASSSRSRTNSVPAEIDETIRGHALQAGSHRPIDERAHGDFAVGKRAAPYQRAGAGESGADLLGREAGLLRDLHRLVRRRRRLLEAAGRIEHGRALQQRLDASFFARRQGVQPARLVERLGRPSHVAGVAED